MHRLTKLIITFVGLLLILLAIFEASQVYVIPGITLWLSELVMAAPELWNSTLLLFAVAAGGTGTILLTIGLFYPTHPRKLADH